MRIEATGVRSSCETLRTSWVRSLANKTLVRGPACRRILAHLQVESEKTYANEYKSGMDGAVAGRGT